VGGRRQGVFPGAPGHANGSAHTVTGTAFERFGRFSRTALLRAFAFSYVRPDIPTAAPTRSRVRPVTAWGKFSPMLPCRICPPAFWPSAFRFSASACSISQSCSPSATARIPPDERKRSQVALSPPARVLDTSPESGPLSGFVDGHGVEHSGIIPEYRGVPLHIGVPLFGGDVNGRVGVA